MISSSVILVEQMEVELAVADVRGEVLYVERLFFGEAHCAEFGGGLGQHLFRRRKFHVGKQSDEAAVDCVGGGACELLENNRARQRLEALTARLDSERTDLGDNPCEDRIGLAKMHPSFASIIDFVGSHCPETTVRRILHAC